MKKTCFFLLLVGFFILCFLLLKFPVIIGFGITITTIDLLFHTSFLSNCIYLEIFILDFILSYYITYRSRSHIQAWVYRPK